MAKFKRKRLLVDPKVQWTLAGRVVLYWISCVATVNVVPAILAGPLQFIFGDTNEIRLILLSQLAAVVLFIPLIAYDIIRVSNRIVGPMRRMLWNMQKLAAGDQVRHIKFRDGDFWFEFAEGFNGVVDEMDKQRSLATQSDTSDDSLQEVASSSAAQ